MNHFYRFSLESFVDVFTKSIRNTTSSELCDVKDNSRIRSTILSNTIQAYGISISKGDYLAFALYISHGINPKPWGGNMWDFFLGSLLPTDTNTSGTNTFPYWGADDARTSFTSLQQQCPILFRHDLDLNSTIWQAWSESEDCMLNFPDCHLSIIERLLFIKTFRPDNLNIAITRFCCSELAIDDLFPQMLTIHHLWKEIIHTQTSPVMFVTSPDMDPSADIESLCIQEIGKNR